MATLQRSTAFRKQGSSGVVWEDEYFLKEDKVDYKELKAMSEGESCQHDRSRQIEGRIHCFPSQVMMAMNDGINRIILARFLPRNLLNFHTVFLPKYPSCGRYKFISFFSQKQLKEGRKHTKLILSGYEGVREWRITWM
ncbi:hypothetical protein NC653_039200 [Populus alba x Populus x berolinensis]|uniref:Uncharacterized protein n=1 Tax=Populus alba x Populus x berolinensis TaxID=444605 RepID=A0AAD6PQC0_9ROSI|nr:hypothetical protein NC653_039200 [Populus alba x Populus x berolinensis]